MKQALPLLLICAAARAAVPADSTRGQQLFQTLACVQCHSINGVGGKIGPDLGRRIDRGFTPGSLAATMWNHAPAMWAAMRERDIRAGDLNDQAAMDLFAYFYSAHFFDQPGDAGRGKALFTSKGCEECHGLATTKIPETKSIANWETIGSPISLAAAMWNHVSRMRDELVGKSKSGRPRPWPALTSQDLTDILVYLRNLPSARPIASRVEITSGMNGQMLFESKGCAGCHTGANVLTGRLRDKTLTDIAVEMWNHEPRMSAAPPMLTADEMREITSYLWAEQFFEDSGSASAGARVFTNKHCATCHNDPASGAPRLTGAGRTYTGATMVSVLWHHGPRMLEQMKAKNIAWPRFEDRDMGNLIAYLNSRR